MAVKLVTQETLTDCGLACVAMVSGQSLATVRKVAIKELGYPKDGPYTTTHENLFKLLAHFGIGHGKKAPFKSLAAMPSLAIMETRKMPSTGNSHLVVFERLPDGDERVLDPGFWLKQQERRDWNRIKLDTFVPVLLAEQAGSPKKGTKKAAAEVVESAGPDAKTVGVSTAKTPKTAVVKAAGMATIRPPCGSCAISWRERTAKRCRRADSCESPARGHRDTGTRGCGLERPRCRCRRR